MLDQNKTRDELIIEVKELREQISKLTGLENERKRAEEALRNNEKFLNNIFDGIQDGISVLDTDLNIIRVNKTMERWHQDMLPLVGKKCFYAYHGRSKPCEYCPNTKAMKEKTTHVKTVPREVAGKIVGWQEVYSFPLQDDGGNIIGLIDYVRDVTERKRAEEALKESQQMLQLVMDSIPQAIFWKDTNSVYLGCNKVVAHDVGLEDPGEIIGKTDYDLSTTKEQSESYREYDQRVMSTDKPIYHIIEMQRRPDDTIAWLDTNKIPLHDSDGVVIGVLCTYEDITERRHAEEALRESEKRFKQLIESSPMPMALYDKNEDVEYLNEKFVKAFGYTLEDLPNVKSWWLHAYPDEVYRAKISDSWHSNVEEAIIDGTEIKPIENNITCKDGSVRVMEAIGSPIGDKILVAFSDITERKRAEDALRRSKQILKQSQEIAHLGSWEFDLMTNTVSWSDEVYRIYGLQPREFGATYEAFLEAVHPDDRTAVDSAYWGSIHEGRDTYEIEHRVLRRSTGEVRIVHEKCEHFRDASGRVIRSVGMALDITDRKRSEEKVRLAYMYNRSLIESSLDPLVTIAPDGKITDVNLATEKVTGYPREKLIGTDFSNYFTDPEKAKDGYRTVFEQGSVTDYPLEIRHRNGHVTPVIYNASVYSDASGRVIGVFAAARDITDRKRAEEALEEAKNQAEIYLDLMGHDINNLNQVGMGYLELALDTLNLDQKGRDLIAKPLEALKNSSKLIDNVRKVQQVKTGEPKLYEIDVARLLRDLIPKYTNTNDREVTINYVSGCHCFVMANDLLADVFSNILGNAVKHSSGHLTINVRVSKVESVDQAYCKVTIEDNGPGIPDHMKKKLFSRFQRGYTKASGKGLGLYLVRSLVQHYHGYVWIEDSIPGDHTKGTRFVVMLPNIKDALSYDKFYKTKPS